MGDEKLLWWSSKVVFVEANLETMLIVTVPCTPTAVQEMPFSIGADSIPRMVGALVTERIALAIAVAFGVAGNDVTLDPVASAKKEILEQKHINKAREQPHNNYGT